MKRNWGDPVFKEFFINVVRESFTISEVMKKINLQHFPGNTQTVKKHIAKLGLDTSHFRRGGFKISNRKKLEIKDVCVKESSVSSTSRLRKLIIREKALQYKCQECNQCDVFRGKKLVLQLDHVNGIKNDNRLENLRFLCPNCHSQTDTFSGKNVQRKNIDIFLVIDLYLKTHHLEKVSKKIGCGYCKVSHILKENQQDFLEELEKRKIVFLKELKKCFSIEEVEEKTGLSYRFLGKKIDLKYKMLKRPPLMKDRVNKKNQRNKKAKCLKCNCLVFTKSKKPYCLECKTEKERKEKIIMEDLVDRFPLVEIGKTMGITGNAVKKRCKKLGIKLKPIGFWTKHFYLKKQKEFL